MTLPKSVVAKMEEAGLIVRGPWSADGIGWQSRFTVGAKVDYHAGIEVLPGPVLCIYEDDGAWYVTKRECVPDPGPTDFSCEFSSAEDAVTKVLQFFRR